MRAREIFLAETARIEHRHGQRVAHGQDGGGAGGRRQIQWAGFLVDPGVQVDVGQFAQAGAGIAGHRDQLGAHALDDRSDRHQLGRFAGIGNRDEHVLRGNHAEVAVGRLGRMHEQGRGAGRGQRRGNLACDMAGLADTRHDHPSLATEQ